MGIELLSHARPLPSLKRPDKSERGTLYSRSPSAGNIHGESIGIGTSHEAESGLIDAKALGQGKDDEPPDLTESLKSVKKTLYWTLGLSVVFTAIGTIGEYYMVKGAARQGAAEGAAGVLAQAQPARIGS